VGDIKYKIVLTGKILEGTTREAAISAFANKFKMDEKTAQSTFQNTPLAIKSGVNEEMANAYRGALKAIGVECEIEALEQETAASRTAVQSSAEPKTSEVAEVEPTKSADEPAPSTEDSSASNGHHTFEPENPPGMAFKIEGKPDYSFLTVQVPADQTLKVEASAMATMDTNIRMKTKNLFINDFTAENVPGELGIAPGTPGDLTHQYLDGNTLFLQNSAYVASTQDVNVETKWQGLVKGFFSGESLFLIRCSGKGDLWFNTYGAIIEVDVKDDYVVDTGNIVAFTEGLEYNITKVGGYKSLFFSGEGFVCRFSGEGKVWIQTRSAQAFKSWAHFYRPVQSKG